LLGILKEGEDWEQVLFEAACAGAREMARQLLEGLDEALAGQREPGWVIEGYRSRTVLTRFGPVAIRRRLYRKGKQRRLLLDEALHWRRGRAVSPTLTAIATELVSRVPYRVAADLLGKLISQSVGATTLHRLVQELGRATQGAEERARTATYEQGQGRPTGTAVANPLFVEADGVMLALQREAQRRGELRCMIAYADSTTPQRDGRGRVRRALVGKVSYAGMEAGAPFWEGAWVKIAARYDLARTELVVLGGDGAAWIRGGLTGVEHGLFQLDRFHLARELRRVLGPTGMVAFQAARAGRDAELKELLAQAWAAAGADPDRTRELQRVERYLSHNRDGLVDWQQRAERSAPSAVHLGAMEANIDKPYAHRFKKRGMSWTRAGAQHLAKVIQLRESGELPTACWTLAAGPAGPAAKVRPATAASTAPRTVSGSPPPFAATFAPRWGPHASRIWVQVLCRLLAGPTLPT